MRWSMRPEALAGRGDPGDEETPRSPISHRKRRLSMVLGVVALMLPLGRLRIEDASLIVGQLKADA
jgi:hypothetical protein